MIRYLSTFIKKNPIIITDNAYDKMGKILSKKNNHAFLFSADSGGCNGFNYSLKLIHKNQINELFENEKIPPSRIEEKNIQVYIDPLSEIFLLGTTIDYVNENIDKGIFENKFIFIPDKQLATSCGCGISFMPKNI